MGTSESVILKVSEPIFEFFEIRPKIFENFEIGKCPFKFANRVTLEQSISLIKNVYSQNSNFRKIRHKPEVRISLKFFFTKPEVDIKSHRRANFERIQSGRYGDIRVFPTKKYIFRVFKVI